MAKEVNIESREGWYNITAKDIHQYGGEYLMRKFFGNSVVRTLQFVYPDYQWLAWKFQQPVFPGFWNDRINRKEFMDWFGSQLGYKILDDWYNITTVDFVKNGGGSLLYITFDGSILETLSSIYSTHQWDPLKFQRLRKT
jgi:hypothetical protein